MGSWRNLVFLFYILINIVGLSISQPDFVFVDCEEWFGNHTTNSTYQRNLNILLSSLSSNTNSFGFYNSSLGENPDTVNAMVLCRGDTDLDSCHSCINNATSKITQDCPKSKEAVGWYDLCMVRYSNESINGKANASGYCSRNPLNVFSVDQFNQSLTTLFDGLISQAASGGTLQKFAMGNVSSPDDQTIYGFMQCSPDLSEQNCSYCLGVAMAAIQSCNLNEREGGRMNARSCSLRFETVPFLDEIPADSPPLPGRYVNRNRRVIMIVVFALASAVLLIILIFIFLWKWKQRKPRDEVLVSEAGDKISTIESLQYNFVTISNATDNFCDENLLGKGGFGAVYKGRLISGNEIAVKRLSMNSGQGDVEFKNEAMLVARLQHRNLVRLLGFCMEGRERLLIYEFVTNLSLDQSIFDPIKRAELDWDTRYKIIGGIARGLLYLHEDSRLRIIHRDLKASNVLLDAKMNPKISDFGMARMFALDETEGNTNRIVGTYGYMAPEYAMHGHFSVKSDVFSFGVLVLEIVTGQKNSCFRNGENVEDLLSYAWKSWLEGKASNLIDPTLEANSESICEIERCIHIGLLCVQENIADRPTMASVVHMLKTSSLTLSMPSEPAFFLRSSIGPQKPVLHQFDSMVESNRSKPKSACLSVDKASITGCYPR